MDDILLEPLRAFKGCYEKKFDENAENYFNDLVKKSGINVDENRQTVKKYKAELTTIEAIENKLKQQKALRGFMIFLAVAGLIMAIVGIYSLVQSNVTIGSVLLSVGVTLTVLAIVIIAALLNKNIKHHEEQKQKHEKLADELLKDAWKQMYALNCLFESNATKTLIEMTVPLIKIDDNFDMRRYDYLSGKYGFGDNLDNSKSTIAILTGEILGNPFVVDRELVQTMGTETYTGTLVIHWTTTYRGSDGKTHTQHHTQTLVAHVTKPKPYYSQQTRLIYGNEAAPNLCFTHKPSHAEKMSDKTLESKVKSGTKKIRKLQQKQVQNGGSNFTEMGNNEFDVLFGALDRNNEVEFRLLFTPLAQKNMLELMKDDYAFGDDFYFTKARCLNFISSEHSAHWDLDTYYTRYQSYDVDEAHSKFKGFNRNYFKALFFELAPLLSIPLYQQHKPKEYIYQEDYFRNYTSYEAEYAVNKMGRQVFEHNLSATEAILKTNFMAKDGKSDKIRVTAYSYRAENRVEFVPTFGGDGFIHNVPVHWTEYIPVERESTVKLKQLDMTDKEFAGKLNDSAFKSVLESSGKARVFAHGLLCCLVAANNISFDTDINKVLQ